jgi:hypothetical protein
LTGHTVPRLKLNAEDQSIGDTEADFLERQEFSIREVIEKKLVHNWAARDNWLCIVLDDVTNWHDISMTNLLAEVHGLYRDELRLISMLWFVGYQSWIS